jgi:catechol 2,3-dioxygenase-like lactoylglutathione lyase family enzyme
MPDTINFENSIPILRVSNLKASVDFYRDVLGFALDWEAKYGFASVSRGRSGLYLAEGDQGQTGSWVWIGVGDVEPLFEEYLASGAAVRTAPTNFPWALEMQVEDADRNVLRFGSDPLDGEPQGPWRDMKGDNWIVDDEGGWAKADAEAATAHLIERANQARQAGKLKQTRWSLFNAVELLRRQRGRKEDLARALRGLGEIERVKFPALGQKHYEEAIALFRELDLRWRLAQALGHLAMLHHDAGRVDAAGPLYEEAMSICRRSDGIAPLDYANTANRLAKFKHEIGKAGEAEPLWEAAHLHYSKAGIDGGVVGTALDLARLNYSEGNQSAADEWLAKAEAAAQNVDDPATRARVAEVKSTITS